MTFYLLERLTVINKFLKKSHFKSDRASLKINDIDDISLLGTHDCHHCCSIA
jgi:hypothetical protein